MDRFRISSFFEKRQSMTWADVIEKPDLEGRLSSSEPHVSDFVSDNLDRLIATATEAVPENVVSSNADAATVYPKNATFLLGAAPRYNEDLAPVVVHAAMGALKTRTLHHVAAQNIHAILAQAIAHAPAASLTAAAEAAGDAEVFHCLLRQVGAHSVVGEALLVLLGAGLQNPGDARVAMSLWSEHGLAMHVAKYATVALSHPGAGCYFSFIGNALSHALSEPTGQFLDDLFAFYDGGADDLSVIVFNALENAALNGGEYVHLGEGLLAVSSVVTTLSRGVFGTGVVTERDYNNRVCENRCIASVLQGLPRVVRLLQCEALNSPFGRQRRSYGLLRLRLLEVFMSVHRLNRRESDQALQACDFYAVLFDLAEEFPSHDILLNCVSEVCCDAATRDFDKTLLQHLVRDTKLPQRLMRWKAGAKAPSIVAVACQVSRVLGPALTPAEEREVLGDVAAEWASFLDFNFSDTKQWYATITGDEFNSIGSGKFPPVVHQAPITLATKAASPSIIRLGDRNSFPKSDPPPPQQDPDRRSRYSADEDDGDGTWGGGDDGDEADDAMSAWLKDGRAGFPAEDDEEEDAAGAVPAIAALQPASGEPADDGDDDAVLGEEWIERTIEELEDATSPQPKHRTDGSDVLEEWGSPQPAMRPDEHDDSDDARRTSGTAGDESVVVPAAAPAAKQPLSSAAAIDDEDEDW